MNSEFVELPVVHRPVSREITTVTKSRATLTVAEKLVTVTIRTPDGYVVRLSRPKDSIGLINRRRMKCLFYDGTGLVLIAKRIERGSFMSHSERLGRSEITLDELKLKFHGSVIRRPTLERSSNPLVPALAANSVTQRESFALPKGACQNLSFGSANPATP